MVADEASDTVTAVVPAHNGQSRDQRHREPVLEIKQKTSSRHEKRTQRDYYRHSGDDKRPPIEYVYTHTEETPREESGQTSVNGLQNGQQSSALVPAGSNGKVECFVGEDGNLVVKIRGKPGDVPLDPKNLPIQLPDGWQLKEVRTNQRSRKTERSRKTRIKDEVTEIEGASTSQTQTHQTSDTLHETASSVSSESGDAFGNAQEEEYQTGEENGVAYVEKKFRKYEKGAAGLTSKVEHIRSEESTVPPEYNGNSRYKRNLTSVLEKTENANRKFSKQQVVDEKVTETHKSDVVYFDNDETYHAEPTHLRDRQETTTYRDSNRESVIIESPEDTPYNTLTRNDRHRTEDMEIIDNEDRYHLNQTHPRTESYSQVTDTNIAVQNVYGNQVPESRRYGSNLQSSRDVTIERDTHHHRTPMPLQNHNHQISTREETVRTEKYVDESGRSGYRQPPVNNGNQENLYENVERTSIEDRYQIHGSPSTIPPPERSDNHQVTRRTERKEFVTEQEFSRQSDKKQQVADRRETVTQKQITAAPVSLFPIPGSQRNEKQVKVDHEEHIYENTPQGIPEQNMRSVTERREDQREESAYINVNRSSSQSTQQTKAFNEDSRNETNVENTFSSKPVHPPFGKETGSTVKEERTERVHDAVLPGNNFKCAYPPQPYDESSVNHSEKIESSYVRDRLASDYSELIDKTNIEDRYRIDQSQANKWQQAPDSALPTQLRPASATSQSRQHPIQQISHSSSKHDQTIKEDYNEVFRDSPVKNMVGTEIRIDASDHSTGRSPVPQQDRKGKDRVTIDDRYRVVGRTEQKQPVVHRNHLNNDDNQSRNEVFHDRNSVTTDTRAQSRLTEFSTGERVIPIGITPAPRGADSRHSSRLSSVDLSEIKPGENLDNSVLKDRSNLAQVGALGQRRPPTRHPSKFQYAEEDIVSTSDTTLPTQFEPSFRSNGISSALNVNSHHETDWRTHNHIQQTSSVTQRQQHQSVRDERVLLNNVDEVSKPDWVRNIDQHFSGRGSAFVQYRRETQVSSPTPRIEEIVTIPNGSTVIQVSGEHGEPVKGIVTEPGDRPVISQDLPIEKDMVHQAQQGSQYGFTRVTDSKGYKQSAKERVQFQERRESSRQISVSYELPGVGKEVREFTWRGTNEKPEEKVTFHEERDHRKDVSVNLQLEQQKTINTTETTKKVQQETIVFDEVREAPRREVAVNFKLQDEQREVVRQMPPVQTNTFQFEEEVKRNREVSLVMGLDQQPLPQHVSRTEQTRQTVHHNLEKVHDVRTEHIERHDYFEPPKVTFHEDREVHREVAVQLALENVERPPARELTPLPVEKFKFEETRVIPANKDVSFVVSLDQPPPEIQPRPQTVMSSSTVATQEIVPEMRRTAEQVQKTQRIERYEQPLPPPMRAYEETKKVERFEEVIELAADVDIEPPVEQPPTAELTAIAEITPPKPRKVSLQAAIEATELYHTEENHVPHPGGRIYETAVDLKPHEKRLKAEAEIEIEQPKPNPLPPTSGRVEKHVNLETLVPEPTGQPLPQSLGTYGYVYTATLEPKKPEPEESIEFNLVESKPTVTETVEVEAAPIEWYVKPGRVPSLVPSEASVVEEIAPVLRAQAEVAPPTLVEATAEIRPPQPKMVADVRVESPPKPKYYGDDEEDRESISSKASSIHEIYRNEAIKPHRASADATHQARVDFATTEEERWKTNLERIPKPKPSRAETSLNLEKAESPVPVLPTPVSRVTKQIHQEKIKPSGDGRPLPGALGTYGFVYMTHVNPNIPIKGKPIEVFEAGIAQVDFDIPQVIETAIEKVEPKLTREQEKQLLEASVQVFPPLTVKQQEQLLHTLVEIHPPLTPEQQRQLLTGESVHPPLGKKQEEQIAKISAEIIPPLGPKQKKDLLYATTTIHPPLTPVQQNQILQNVEKILPQPKVKKTEKLVEKFEASHHDEEEEERLLILRRSQIEAERTERSQIEKDIKGRIPRYPGIRKDFPLDQREESENEAEALESKRRSKSIEGALYDTEESTIDIRHRVRTTASTAESGRIPRRTWSEMLQKEHQPSLPPRSIGVYEFLTLEPKNPMTPMKGSPLRLFESGLAILKLEVERFLTSIFMEIEPALSEPQQNDLLEIVVKVFPPLTMHQQERLLRGLVEMFPKLSFDQMMQLLNGEEIEPPLTVDQREKLARKSEEIIAGLSTKQQKEIYYAMTTIRPQITEDQQEQIIEMIKQVLPAPRTRKIDRLLEKFDDSTHVEEDEELTLIAARRKAEKSERTEVKHDIRKDARFGKFERDFSLGRDHGRESTEKEETSSTAERRSRSETRVASERSERHLVHGEISKTKEVTLEQQKRWLAEQRMAIDADDDLEVSAFSMNVKPRVRSQMYMDPSPPPRSLMSPLLASGAQYAASPSMRGTPPTMDTSGFMYEAVVDGHGSPMHPELGLYGFTYHATLDGTEPYKKLIETSKTQLDITTASFKTVGEPKPMSATPPRSSPLETPPVTPTPVMGTSTPGSTTPMPPVTSGRSVLTKDVTQDSVFKPVEKTFTAEEAQSGPRIEIVTEKETTEEIVKTLRKHTRKEETTTIEQMEESDNSRPTSAAGNIRRSREGAVSPARYHEYLTKIKEVERKSRKSDDSVLKHVDDAVEKIRRDADSARSTPTMFSHGSSATATTNTSLSKTAWISEGISRKQVEDIRSPSPIRRVDQSKLKSTEDSVKRSDKETLKKLDKDVEKIQEDAFSTLSRNSPVPKASNEKLREEAKEEERKVRTVPKVTFRPEKYARKDKPTALEVTKEEDTLDAFLERVTSSPEASPSMLRKWGKNQALSATQSQTNRQESLSNKTFRRSTTETKNVVEESRFHSEQGLLDALEADDTESNLPSTMSQSLPSLAHIRRMDDEQLKRYGKEHPEMVSMEELRRTTRTVKTDDDDEEETRAVEYARGSDLGPVESYRTKRIVVRKLIDGEWKDVAIHEEDVPMDGSSPSSSVAHPTDRLLADLQRKDDDAWSLTDAVIEETTTTRTVRRVEEEEEDIISLASTDLSIRSRNP